MWQSRKFRIMVYDTAVATIVLLAVTFLAPERAELVIQLIGILQAPVLAVIAGIAIEDAAGKHGRPEANEH